MLEKARNNAKENGYTNIEFRKGDIETRIPVEDNSVNVVISKVIPKNLEQFLPLYQPAIGRYLRSSG